MSRESQTVDPFNLTTPGKMSRSRNIHITYSTRKTETALILGYFWMIGHVGLVEKKRDSCFSGPGTDLTNGTRINCTDLSYPLYPPRTFLLAWGSCDADTIDNETPFGILVRFDYGPQASGLCAPKWDCGKSRPCPLHFYVLQNKARGRQSCISVPWRCAMPSLAFPSDDGPCAQMMSRQQYKGVAQGRAAKGPTPRLIILSPCPFSSL